MISPFGWMQGEELHELHDFKAQIDVLNVSRQLQCFQSRYELQSWESPELCLKH